MSTVRAAVVGTGHLGGFHAEKYAQLPNADLVAVCDLDPNIGKAVASTHGAAFTVDYRELIGKTDAVTIATET